MLLYGAAKVVAKEIGKIAATGALIATTQLTVDEIFGGIKRKIMKAAAVEAPQPERQFVMFTIEPDETEKPKRKGLFR